MMSVVEAAIGEGASTELPTGRGYGGRAGHDWRRRAGVVGRSGFAGAIERAVGSL